MRFDVVVVGAGIGGTVLALDLGARGWRVALLERESAPPRMARPEIITLEELVRQITPKNRHGETDMGTPVGNEVW